MSTRKIINIYQAYELSVDSNHTQHNTHDIVVVRSHDFAFRRRKILTLCESLHSHIAKDKKSDEKYEELQHSRINLCPAGGDQQLVVVVINVSQARQQSSEPK